MFLSAEELEKQLKELNMIVPVRYFDSLPSTNTKAKELRLEGGEELLVVAGRQTGGKGRNGRSFQSDFGGAYFSFTFSLGAEHFMSKACGSVMLGALAVRSVLSEYGVNCDIKWPNDVLVSGRKICGMLSEVVYDRDFPDFAVTGIGINVNNSLPGLETIATSLSAETGKVFSVAEIIARVVRRFFEMYTDKNYDILEDYRKFCVTLGKNVKVTSPAEEFYAFAENVDDNGMLVVRTRNGNLKTVSCGDVSIREVLS